VLLVSSGLMIRTFQAMRKVQPGFTRPEEVLTLRLSILNAQAPIRSVFSARINRSLNAFSKYQVSLPLDWQPP